MSYYTLGFFSLPHISLLNSQTSYIGILLIENLQGKYFYFGNAKDISVQCRICYYFCFMFEIHLREGLKSLLSLGVFKRCVDVSLRAHDLEGDAVLVTGLVDLRNLFQMIPVYDSRIAAARAEVTPSSLATSSPSFHLSPPL